MIKINRYMRRIAAPGALLFGLGTLTLLGGCNKMMDVDSRHIVNEENKWKDINDARGSLMGVYGLLRSALAQDNAHWMYGELRGGDFTAVNKRDLEVIISGDLNSSYALVQNLSNWRKFYAVINAANLFIEKSGQIVTLDAQYTSLNNKIDVAQMRVIKGFCYYLLARTWGDVPIWDKAYEGNFPSIKQSSEKEVLAYAEQEVKAAKDILPFVYADLTDPIYPAQYYFGQDRAAWNGVLFNRLSANAILAHIAASSNNYLGASIYADYVLTNAGKGGAAFIESSNLTNANGFFFNSSNSQLVAFPFKWSANEASYQGHLEQLTLASPLVSKAIPDIYIPTDRIVQIFDEPSDVRFQITSTGEPQSTYFSNLGGLYPIFSKIKVIREGVSGADGSLPLFSSAIVFSRLEEIALLKAESLVVLGQNDEAKGLLDQVRKSRGLAEAPAGNLLDQIFSERRRELMGEGWRWYDLVRYNKIKRDNAAFNTLIDQKGIFWPVAKEALNNNKALKQNPYWL
ncbi:RagB/SusD family nutrient uptake outer membrane protein [Sphingobacterium sp. JUb20]|uniref:RagB/SusD family nutrient uptake outer membrane protein n=2 Tax=Sphingobacterium TaxID=28453 RepID=UPI0010495EBE|nr:RagB/SusD family nutrient uptake outer membrane protein [Sphingobacterium sp. JUb20]